MAEDLQDWYDRAASRFGRPSERTVDVATAAAPPPATVIGAMEGAGFRVTHLYGLTETYGPAVVSPWHREWDDLPLEQRAAKKAHARLPGMSRS